jgi:hypothetical protein
MINVSLLNLSQEFVCVCISQYPFRRCISDTNGDSLHLAQNLYVVGKTGEIF